MMCPQVHEDEGPGDILVFLTGQDEIESCERLLKERVAGAAHERARLAGTAEGGGVAADRVASGRDASTSQGAAPASSMANGSHHLTNGTQRRATGRQGGFLSQHRLENGLSHARPSVATENGGSIQHTQGAENGGASAARDPEQQRLELLVVPIYAALPPEAQMRVFEPAPPGMRKASS